jgi:hypothetical protein
MRFSFEVSQEIKEQAWSVPQWCTNQLTKTHKRFLSIIQIKHMSGKLSHQKNLRASAMNELKKTHQQGREEGERSA